MQENQPKKLTFKDVKKRVADGWRAFVRFFKEFKWDKAHVSVIVKYAVEILLFAFIITFDLCMKDFLYDFVEVEHGGNFTVIDGFLDLTYSENTGMGFGLGQDSTLGITVMTAILIVAILGYLIFFKKEKAYIRIPLIMVAAGGIGNLVDRTQLGYVRDFFEFTFMDFAIFNIADAFVTVGAIVLIIALILMLVFPSKDKRIPQDDEKEGEKAAFTVESADEASGSASGAEDGDETALTAESAASSENAGNAVECANNAAESADTAENADAAESTGVKERAAFTVTAEGEEKKVAFTVTADKGTESDEG